MQHRLSCMLCCWMDQDKVGAKAWLPSCQLPHVQHNFKRALLQPLEQALPCCASLQLLTSVTTCPRHTVRAEPQGSRSPGYSLHNIPMADTVVHDKQTTQMHQTGPSLTIRGPPGPEPRRLPGPPAVAAAMRPPLPPCDSRLSADISGCWLTCGAPSWASAVLNGGASGKTMFCRAGHVTSVDSMSMCETWAGS